MRAAVIFGLGTSSANLRSFRDDSSTEWIEGVPASSNNADAILIFGGDGTIHRHLPALVRLQLPVLVVPAGSGNDFARALHLNSVRDALRAWRNFESGAGNVRSIDLGTITERGNREAKHYFCCVAGCGIDTAVARKANRMPRWLRRHGGYVLGLVPTIFQFSPIHLRITANGGIPAETPRPLLLAAFANAPYFGDGMHVAPRALMDDGKLDLCMVNPLNRLKLLSLFPSVYFGRHLELEEVEYSQSERVFVDSPAPVEIYADGEYVCETPVEIRVERGALRVIAET
ncbi:MAG: diacylglycerol kinase family lipid kinase [Acidobacteria bacterium]|nr:diacylglycerol kinase family lipid kinase [Acidobacteriota bacterium]